MLIMLSFTILIKRINEFEILKDNIESIKKEFNCDVEIIKAEESDEPKAKQAMPGKVAMIIE